MKRPDTILVLLSLLVFCLQGCGDEEKGDAMAKWAAFQTEQIETIQADIRRGGFEAS